MNIDEERKAFAVALSHALADRTVEKLGEDCRDRAVKNATRYIAIAGFKERDFDIWLAAKKHAQEDIKKLLNICAFETIEDARAYYAEQKPVGVSVVTAQDTYTAGFAAGLAHAEEMAKPVARYALIGGIVNLYFDVGLDKPGVYRVAYFETVADAKVWAANNGYRVVEE